MPDPLELLSTTSEFSIGMAGFAGIVAIFIGTNPGWTPIRKFRAGNLIILSFVAGFSSLASLGVAQYINSDDLWRVSCVVQLILSGAMVLFIAPSSRSAFGHSIFSTKRPVNFSIWLSLYTNFSLQAVGALGLLGAATFGVFYAGLLLHLVLAALNFYRLIFQPNDDPERNV